MFGRRSLILLLVSLLLVALLGYFGTRTWMEYRMAGVLDRQLALLPGQVEVSYDNVRVKLFQRTLRLDGVRISLSPAEPPIRLQALVLHRIDRNNPIPHDLEVEVRGFEQRLSGSRLPLAGLLQNHGYAYLRGSAFLHYRYLPEERRLELPRLRLSLTELGELVMEGAWPQHRPAGLPLLDWRVVDSLALDFLELTYRDEGLVPRMLQYAASSQGMLPASLAANIVAEMEWSAADFSDERLDASVRALRLFLADPQAVRLRLEPESPKPLGELRDLTLVDPPRAALELRLLLSTPVGR